MNRSLFQLPALAIALLCLLLPSVVRAAYPVQLTLTMNGIVIQGEQANPDPKHPGAIECISLESEFFRPAGLREVVHRPVKIVKPIDKATPLLAKALDADETGSAVFRFYRSHPDTGLLDQFFTVTLEGVRVTSERLLLPNILTQVSAASSPLEEVSFTYTTIKLTITNGGIETEIRVR